MDYKELKDFKLSDAIQFHDKLNHNLWHGQHPQPDVKKQLILIAKDFIEELGIKDLDVKDVTVSGSNAAYSYTPNSDLDLHILVDMSNMSNDEVYKELFQAKKTIYNDSHDVKVHGVPVELYVQDASEPVVSLGEYSLLKDKWLRVPTKRRANFDQTATKAKYNKLKDLAILALKSKEYSKVKKLLDTIKRYRQAGLDKGGEFGPENLAFKALRAEGIITKLYDLRDKLHSQKLSIESMYEAPVLDKPTPTISQLVAKHKVSREHILDQLVKGIQVEHEHTSDSKKAREIALDHLGENPNYYTKLKDAKLEEYVEWNTLNRDYSNEKQVGKLLLKAEGGSAGRLHIKAYDMSDVNNPVEAGFADFAIRTTEDGEDYLRAYYTYVHHKYRGKGVAKQMYLFVNEIGNDIKPSENQTDLGKDMWKGLNKVIRQPGGIKKIEPAQPKKQTGWQKFKNLFKMTEQEQEEYDKPIVYLDMDGVLADFNNKYIELFGKEPDIHSKDDPNLQKMIGSDFFATLDKLPGADLLIDNIVKLFGSYSICSSPLRYDHKNSEEHKKKWIQQHLNPQPKFVVITGKKDTYAKGKNILIDDKPKNINAWRDRGGIGILYDAYKDNVNDVIKQLKQIATQLDEDIPVTQGPTQKQRAAAIAKTQPNLGSGYFGKVYDQPEGELGIGTAKKISRFDQDKPSLDGYYAYINRLMSLKDKNDNPYLPQVYNANVVKPKRGAPYFELDMEKLSKWQDLDEDELLMIFSKALDVQLNSVEEFRQLVGRKGVPYKDIIIEELLRYMIKTLSDPNYKDIKGNSIKDPQLIEAINIIRYLEKTGYGEDLHAGNIMVRRTKYGPQLVLTDPLSFGSQGKIDQVGQGKIRVNTIGVTVPPDYFVYVYDKFNNNAVEIQKMYGSYDEIKKEVRQKYDPYWYDVEIIANDRKLDNPAQPPKPRKVPTGAEHIPATTPREKEARNKQHSLKTYAVYDQPKNAPPWKTKKMIGSVKATSENEALRLARHKFQNVPPHKISVMIDIMPSDSGNKLDEEDDYSIEAREVDKRLKAAGYKKLGGGAEAAVYVRDQGSVIKIIMPDLQDMKDLNKDFYNAEKTFLNFYNFVKQNKGNPFLPKFISIQGKDYARFNIGDRTFLQISMEQLYPYKKNSLDEAIIWAFSEFAASKTPWSEVEDHMGDPGTFEYFGDDPQQYYFKAKRSTDKYAKAWQTLAMTDKSKLQYYQLLYETMATLYAYGRANNMGWDLHTENVMRRKDGTLVITDPFYGFINNKLNEERMLSELANQSVLEASGYIPSEKEKNDPRFKTALTVDVKPDSIKKNAKAFGSKISRAGIPPLLRP